MTLAAKRVPGYFLLTPISKTPLGTVLHGLGSSRELSRMFNSGMHLVMLGTGISERHLVSRLVDDVRHNAEPPFWVLT
jgi:hypothetical protein